MSTFSLLQAPENDFVRLRNCVLRDPKISNGARGLWAQCMTHDPNKYTICFTSLVNSTREGKTAVARQMKELVDAGYIIRIQLRKLDSAGRLRFSGVHYVILDRKLENDEKMYIYTLILEKFPESCFLDAETLETENPPLRRLRGKNTKEPKKTNIPSSPSYDPYSHPEPEPPEKEQRKEGKGGIDQEKIRILESLKHPNGETLTRREIERLLRWEVSELERAVSVVVRITPKKTLMHLLCDVLKHPQEHKDPEEALTEQQRMALKHNDLLRHNGYSKIADENETLIREKHCMKAFLGNGDGTMLSLKGPLPTLKEDFRESEAVQEIAKRRRQGDNS
jgi:hypothetical protein